VLLIMRGDLAEGHRDIGETPRAIAVLSGGGALTPEDGRTLAEAYAFLRLLELRVRVMRGDAAHVIEEDSKRLPSIARRMGMRDHPTMPAKARLLERYRTVTEAVSALSERLLSGARRADP
jgi:[glutamine synthetase] adenylyltransferase / [glutamine synthetase]-adenylyl-L-tyrosine phosphorylase